MNRGLQLSLLVLMSSMLVLTACGEGGSSDSSPSDIALDHVESEGAADLIPRAVLFGNPEKMRPQLSPAGDLIAYIAPVDSVLNLWVMNIDSSEPRQLTFDTNRGVRYYFWAENNTHILYMQDLAGEENFHVYRLDVATGDVIDMTPFEEVMAYVSATDEDQPNKVIVEMNKINPMFFDVYSCDLETGELTLLQENPGTTEDGDMVLGYMTDEDLNIRGMRTISPEDGTIVIFLKDVGSDEWVEFISFSALD
ncbi:MAG: hypothetical protein KAT47_02135, partial [Candidatus Aegiribacteria sp.]|nr:hypothetical protein [Candidatus Aegiribacteria sp.]